MKNIVSLLLKAGADPFVENDDGCTALSVAAENDDMAMVVLLLEKHISPDDGWRHLPLRHAISNGNQELVKMLFENHADPYSDVHDYAEAPLALAASHDKQDLVKLFLERPAKSDEVKREHICWAFYEASREGNADTIRSLLRYVFEGVKEENLDDVLRRYLGENCDEDLVDLLLSYLSVEEMVN